MILDVIFISLFLFCIYLLWRTDRVYAESMRVIEVIHEKNTADLNKGIPYTGWRYDAMDEISYTEMVFKFWIPVKNFYKDREEIK